MPSFKILKKENLKSVLSDWKIKEIFDKSGRLFNVNNFDKISSGIYFLKIKEVF